MLCLLTEGLQANHMLFDLKRGPFYRIYILISVLGSWTPGNVSRESTKKRNYVAWPARCIKNTSNRICIEYTFYIIRFFYDVTMFRIMYVGISWRDVYLRPSRIVEMKKANMLNIILLKLVSTIILSNLQNFTWYYVSYTRVVMYLNFYLFVSNCSTIIL